MNELIEIQATDLKIKRYEEGEQQEQEKTSAKTLAELVVEIKQKDFIIQQLSQTVATLSLEVQQLKGGAK